LAVSNSTQVTDDRAALIVELMQTALQADGVPAAVEPILASLVRETAAEGSAYFQRGGEVYMARSASGVMPEGPVMNAILVHGLPGDTPLMRALEKAPTPLFFDDTGADPVSAGFPDLGVPSLAAAPVRTVDGELIGAFLMHTFSAHHWSDGEATLVAAVAGALAGLTARLVAEEQAVEAHESALRALGLALEYRDRETKGHTDRVTNLALRVADALNLSESQQTALRWGAYLHDVGKIAIPDAVLLKPGPLDDVEWETIRSHPSAGHAFASQLPFLPQDVLDVVHCHHERWDGSGYPDGRAGEEIPLPARVFAICDVYDALTSERPYKQAWTIDRATEEIRSQAGRQFDPRVVDAFLALVEQGWCEPS
jgi:putative nucleotidyltransferase with HDIG domain